MKNYNFLIMILSMFLAVSFTQSAVVYHKDGNKLEINTQIKKNQNVFQGRSLFSIQMNNNNSARFCLLGSKKISSDISTYGLIQYIPNLLYEFKKIKSDIKTDPVINLNFFGIHSKKWGTLDYGRNYGIISDIQYFSKNKNKKSNFLKNNGLLESNSSNLVTYCTKNSYFFPKSIILSLQYQDQNYLDHKNKKNIFGFGSSAIYKVNPHFSVASSYFFQNRSKMISEDKNGKFSNAYGLLMKYYFSKSYISIFYGNNNNIIFPGKALNIKKHNNLLQLIISHHFNVGLNTFIVYSQSNLKQIVDINPKNLIKQSNSILKKNLKISANYKFDRNTNAYINYNIDLNNYKNDHNPEKNIDSKKLFEFGIEYNF